MSAPDVRRNDRSAVDGLSAAERRAFRERRDRWRRNLPAPWLLRAVAENERAGKRGDRVLAWRLGVSVEDVRRARAGLSEPEETP